MKSPRTGILAVTLALMIPAPAAAQDFDFGAFARGVVDEALRQAQQDEAEDYRREQQKRFDRYRRGSRGYQGDYRELYSDGGLKGRYVVESPLGPVGIRFSTEDGSGRSRVGGSRYGEYLATQLDQALSEMHGILQGTGTAGVPRTIRKTQEEVDQLLQAFRNDERERALGHFHDFEEDWNSVQRALSQAEGLPQPGRMYQLKRQADNYRDELAAMLDNGRDRGRGWDRVSVAALVDRLERQTDALRNRYEEEIRRRPGGRLDRLISRVNRRARDLYQAVHNNDPYEYVVEEYRAFDSAWHELRDILASRRGLDEAFDGIDRSVSLIDRRLHYILRVEPPAAGRGRSVQGLAERIARSSDELVRELQRRNALRGALRDSAEALAYQSDQLSHVLQRTPPGSHRIDENLDRVEDLIEEVLDQLENRDAGRYADDLAESIESDISQLENNFG